MTLHNVKSSASQRVWCRNVYSKLAISTRMVKARISDSYEFHVQGSHKNLRKKMSKLATTNMTGIECSEKNGGTS